MQGKLYVFEAVDGAGKTTVLQHVALQLLAAGVTIVLTKEPGGPAALRDELRFSELEIYLAPPYENGPRYRAMCFDKTLDGRVHRAIHRADSLENWVRIVKPAIEDGYVVLSDRGWPSDIAYGHVFNGLSIDQLYMFNAALSKDQIDASTVIFFEVSPEVAERRLAGNQTNFYDDPAQRNLRVRVQNSYKEFFNTWPDIDVRRVDADLPLQEVVECVTKMILSDLSKKVI